MNKSHLNHFLTWSSFNGNDPIIEDLRPAKFALSESALQPLHAVIDWRSLHAWKPLDGGDWPPRAASSAPWRERAADDSWFAATFDDLDGQSLRITSTKERGGPPKTQKNFSPQAADDSLEIREGEQATVNVLNNDVDSNGDPLLVIEIDGAPVAVGETRQLASGATATLEADGFVRYDAKDVFDLGAGEIATDYLTYTVSDGRGGVASARLWVTILGVDDALVPNAAPDAVDDAYAILEGDVLSGDLLGNDADVDGDPLSVVALNGVAAAIGSTVTLASGARLTVGADGAFSYDPAGSFDGLAAGEIAVDGFDYTISDGSGGSAKASATVTITGESSASDGVEPPPYYVTALLAGDQKRLNYPEPYGSAAAVTFAFAQESPP